MRRIGVRRPDKAEAPEVRYGSKAVTVCDRRSLGDWPAANVRYRPGADSRAVRLCDKCAPKSALTYQLRDEWFEH